MTNPANPKNCKAIWQIIMVTASFVSLNTVNANSPNPTDATCTSCHVTVEKTGAIARAEELKEKREPVLEEAERLLKDGKRNEGMDALEVYLSENPDDIVVGNRYRNEAVEHSLHDRPIRFFNNLVIQNTPYPDDLRGGPPMALRYNLAFAYIDKIPVVGPMGAGFLSKRSIAQFQSALDDNPDDWIANYGVGMNYLHWPDYFEKNDSSVSYFRKCIELQKQRSTIIYDILPYVRLGDAYAKVGQLEDATDVWNEGLEYFPEHADLKERLAIPSDKLVESIKEAYNPNNSIGEINTDISILWASVAPDSVFSLLAERQKRHGMGVGGQRLAEREDDDNLFRWFRDNLPYLSRRDSAEKVNMKQIGATASDGVGVIAFNMIQGFMTQFRGDTTTSVKTALEESPKYDLPFFHEGIGMGMGAAIDTSSDSSLADFGERIAIYGDEFDRLHYAGLGMWFGLAPTLNLVKVRKQLSKLSLRGQFYAYEGLGFAVTLFNADSTDQSLKLLEKLPFAAGSTFAHGMGRALWIKHGGESDRFEETVEVMPEKLRSHLRSGFGMGVAFTRIDKPVEIGENIERFADRDRSECVDYLAGVTMGYAIRYETDPLYVRNTLKEGSDKKLKQLAPGLLKVGLDSLKSIQSNGDETHNNWRTTIRSAFLDETNNGPLVNTACGSA